jgi:cytochrome c biogenesis protein CcdA
VWTPCAGPVLGTILTLIATQGTTGKASLLVIFYATGAGVPMIIIAYGSQWLTTKIRGLVKYSVRVQQAFGVLIILLAVAMFSI